MMRESEIHDLVRKFVRQARRRRLKRAFHRQEWVVWSVRYDSNLIGSYKIYLT